MLSYIVTLNFIYKHKEDVMAYMLAGMGLVLGYYILKNSEHVKESNKQILEVLKQIRDNQTD